MKAGCSAEHEVTGHDIIQTRTGAGPEPLHAVSVV